MKRKKIIDAIPEEDKLKDELIKTKKLLNEAISILATEWFTRVTMRQTIDPVKESLYKSGYSSDFIYQIGHEADIIKRDWNKVKNFLKSTLQYIDTDIRVLNHWMEGGYR